MSSSADGVAPGTVVAGFRVERPLPGGGVHEATQLSLGRTVALRLLDAADVGDPARFDERQRLAASIDHPALVPVYEVGSWGDGRFVASRFVAGRTLDELLDRGPAPSPELLAPIAGALAAAHDAGLHHGAVTASNVLVDAGGSAFLADLGLPRAGSAAEDRRALDALRARVERATRRRRARRASAAVLAGTAAAALAVTVVAANRPDTRATDATPPAVARGVTPLGSDLAAGETTPLGCADDPGPNTPSCTIGHRDAVARQDGVIRSWAVRGASGELTLQVARTDGDGIVLTGFSQTVRVPDRGPHVFAADLPIRRGDAIAVLLGPGATIGARADGRDGTAQRWEGGLPYRAEDRTAEPLGDDVLLRADIAPGGRPATRQVSGARARALPPGEVLVSDQVVDPAGATVRVDLVRVGDEVVVDASRGGRRVARAPLDRARADGRLLAFETHCGFRHGFCVRWLNTGSSIAVVHAYRLASGGRVFRRIG